LVERLTADPELAGDPRLLVAGVNAASGVGQAVGRKVAFAATTDAAVVGEDDSLALTLPDQGWLEFSECDVEDE